MNALMPLSDCFLTISTSMILPKNPNFIWYCITCLTFTSKLVYRLTEEGLDLLPLMTEIILWAAKFDEDTAADAGFVEMARTDRNCLYAAVLERI